MEININRKTVYLCTPRKLGNINHQLIERIKKAGFGVFCAVSDTPQDLPGEKIFSRNVELIKKADIFIAVLKDYGKDLACEVGMAFAWNKPRFGLDYTAEKSDVMCFYSLEKIIKPDDLEEILEEYR